MINGAIFFSLLAVLPTASPQTSDTFSSERIVAAAKAAVVFIVTSTNSGAQSGSGFILSSNSTSSVVVTANHVIQGGARSTDVILDSNPKERYHATIVAQDEAHDIAILRISEGNRQNLNLAMPSSMQEGEQIVLMGYPMATLNYMRVEGDDLRPTIHTGVVSAIRFHGELIQFDAATFHGDSGGPILDSSGHVIAIVHGENLDPRFAAVGLEQPLPGTAFGPSAARIRTFIDDTETANVKAPGNNASPDPAIASASASLTTPVRALVGDSSSAEYRVGYGLLNFHSQNLIAQSIDDQLETNVIARLTASLKDNNSIYLIPVSLTKSVTQNPETLTGFCADDRLEAFAYPEVRWNFNQAEAAAQVGLYVFDCAGERIFAERKVKSEGRLFANRTPEKEVVDMSNDLMDQLLADFAKSRLSFQASWKSLFKTGLFADPDNGRLLTLFSVLSKQVSGGYQVAVVVPKGPADKSGLLKDDIVTKIGDTDTSLLSVSQFFDKLNAASVELQVLRPGGAVTVTMHPEPYQQAVADISK